MSQGYQDPTERPADYKHMIYVFMKMKEAGVHAQWTVYNIYVSWHKYRIFVSRVLKQVQFQVIAQRLSK